MNLKSVSANAIWIIAEIMLVFAVLGEWKATTDSTAKSKAAIAAVAILPSTSAGYCNTVGRAAQLAQRQNNEQTIQWRRGLIASFSAVILVQVLLKMNFSTVNKLTLLAIVWLVYTSVAGYSDYHLNQVSNTAVVDILRLAISRFDDTTCDPTLIDSIN